MVFPKKVMTVILVVLVCAVVVFFVFFKKKAETTPADVTQKSSPQNQEKEETGLPVKVKTAQRGDLIIKLNSPGEAVTDMLITIKTEVSGVIEKLNVEEGQHVQRGDVLVELDDKEYQLELEKREALRLKYLSELFLEKKFGEPDKEVNASDIEKIDKAKKEYERVQQLSAKRLVSREELERAKRQYEFILIEAGGKKEEIRESQLTQAEVDVKKAQMELEKTKVRAPFSGIITDIKVSPFEHVSTGRELFALVDISQIKVEARVLESEIGKIKVGRDVDLAFSAYPNRFFKGRVKAISPIVNPEDKTCKVIIDVANSKEEIKPGMHAEVEIAAEIHGNKLLIPQEAILVREGRNLAFVVEGELAKWRYIEVGLENEDYAEVLDGVKEGEVVIVDGHFTLAHDARVRIEK